MSGVKSNLKAKFGYIQQTMDDIEAELRSLSIATKVFFNTNSGIVKDV